MAVRFFLVSATTAAYINIYPTSSAGKENMKLTQKEVQGVIVVDVHGHLVGGESESANTKQLFKARLEEGNRKFVVNLKNTKWANSTGIGILVGVYTSVSNAGGTVVLTNVVDKINDILSVTRLALVFDSFDNVDLAVAHLNKAK